MKNSLIVIQFGSIRYFLCEEIKDFPISSIQSDGLYYRSAVRTGNESIIQGSRINIHEENRYQDNSLKRIIFVMSGSLEWEMPDIPYKIRTIFMRNFSVSYYSNSRIPLKEILKKKIQYNEEEEINLYKNWVKISKSTIVDRLFLDYLLKDCSYIVLNDLDYEI